MSHISFFTIRIQVSEDNVEYEKDKEEDQEVAKKMAEMEEELKMLSYSESLTDQALGQLKADNERLWGERGSLLQVLYKLSRVMIKAPLSNISYYSSFQIKNHEDVLLLCTSKCWSHDSGNHWFLHLRIGTRRTHSL